MVAKIAVSAATFAIDKPYSYFIPEGMELQPGMRVRVPFGRGNRPSEGVVLSVEAESAENLKWVEQCLDDAPVLDERMLRLAAFIRERYFCTYFDAVRAMLPGGLWFHSRDRYELTEDRSWVDKTIRKPGAKELLQYLADLGGQGSSQQLRQCISDEAVFSETVGYLVRKKWLIAHQELQRNARDKTEQIATLAATVEETVAYMQGLSKAAAMQRSVLELICRVGSAAVKDLCYYTGAKPATVRRLAELGYLTLEARPVLRCREIRPAEIPETLILSQEQETAFQGLSRQMTQEAPGVALLYGVTGSGKTSVYIQLIKDCLHQGKSAMLLVPEIALTPQLLGLMAAYFGQQVAVLHSSLGVSERYDQWKRVRSGDARVVVGTRSAVFAPCQGLGLVILDEEQEHSYKSENNPRYCAREVAIWRGAKEKALVLLGSATPSVESMYRARQGMYRLYTLRSRYNGRPLPAVKMVDMRQELKDGNDLTISAALLDAMMDTAAEGKQTILLLNRRGNSRAMVCVDCREAPECPRCSARLTYHSANHRLMCHYCGFSQTVPQRCPQCGGPMKTVGIGTQKAQQELTMLLPDLDIARMDADTVSAANPHEKMLEHFRNDNVPVLIGTQMVAKGLNLPNVTLVGVLDGDLSLYSDSFRGAETTFNMLTQVVGRAGRGDHPGTAIIQTMVPEHRVLNLAAAQDYDGFYDLEIQLRQHQLYPPFGDLLTVTFTGQEEAQVLRGAMKFRDSLAVYLRQSPYRQENGMLLGPAPCPVPKINYHFRYRLTLRCRLDKPIRSLIAHLLRQFSSDKANRGITAFADVNPME
ncbi:MAG: primosomal protein N' [Oscillospiraceae bacterium]|nr:primosomal protein N' [Oscillospiraceae bacterium]